MLVMMFILLISLEKILHSEKLLFGKFSHALPGGLWDFDGDTFLILVLINGQLMILQKMI